MSRGVNKVILVGLVGNDVDLRYSKDGKAIVQFSLATGKQWRERDTNAQKESTEWHRCVAFEPLSNIIAEHVKKGYKLYLEGENRTRKWVDQQNITRYTTEVFVHTMEIMSSPRAQDAAHSPESPAPPDTNFGHDPDLAMANTGDSFDDDFPY
ncbi:MAG: single-stranded DNA-binding protein [Marinagarivorans sp.]|nr:single-stranded DNA-binding protein [Marinagarivorans sp.]